MKMTSLRSLFMTNLVILLVGYGLFPFLPLYAMEHGAKTGTIGLYLGLTYVAISIGSMLPGWLPARLSRKKLFLAAGLLGSPALLLLGMATAFWQVMVLTALVWFSGGIGLALSSVYTGLIGGSRRGRSFSLVALSTPIASLIGGLLVGQLVTWQGYRFMFAALSLWWLILPLVVLFKLDDIMPEIGSRPAAATAAGKRSSASRFLFLLLAALLAAGAVSVGRLGGSIVMQAKAFSAADVGSTTAVSGAAMIPVVVLMSVLSDRMGRRNFLMVGYALTAAGAAALAVSGELWHFWVATSLLMTGRAVNDSMAGAVATDLLPRAALQRALPRLKAMNWVAGVFSFAGAGYAIEALGTTAIFFISALVALTAAGALLSLPANAGEEVALPPAPALLPVSSGSR